MSDMLGSDSYMDTDKILDYRLYIQREEEFIRADLHAEFRQYNKIKSGDVEGGRGRVCR